ncbi:NACHT domain-containing protein [Rhizobium anhuiense]
MDSIYINRRLKVAERLLSEVEALEQGPVLIVLAEPGAGKTELLNRFGKLLGVTPVRASRFRHQTTIAAGAPLIIDALDEAAKIDQSSVDQIVVKAQELSNGRVIFSSRSSEWQEARTHWIKECFGTSPVIALIEHFDTVEQQALFNAHFPEETFETFRSEAERFELTPLLGNPQFLSLFAAAYVQSGRRFSSKAKIFRDAATNLALEAGSRVLSKPRAPIDEILETASDVMAKILLSGASGVSTKQGFADMDYPYLAAMAPTTVASAYEALDTRLMKPADEPDRHEPVHRIVAEYLAAQHLARRVADSRRPLSIRRTFAIIAPNGAVRDELRGLLGWLASAGDERVQRAAVDLDAYAVLANGDPSQLATDAKRRLLQRLETLAGEYPGFRRSDYWRRFSVGGFFNDGLLEDVRKLLKSTPLTSPLLDLLLELLVNSGGPALLAQDVRSIMLNPLADVTARIWASRAVRRLAGASHLEDITPLVQEASTSSMRVAIDIVADAGVQSYSFEDLAALFRAFASTYPPRRRLRDQDSLMTAYHLVELVGTMDARTAADHVDVLTSGLSCTCARKNFDCQCRTGTSKVAGHLANRYFETFVGPHDPIRVWRWVQSLWFENSAGRDAGAAIASLFDNDGLRRQLHRLAFSSTTTETEVWEKRWELGDGHGHSGLSFHPGDAEHMADHAFQIENAALWAAFWSRPAARPDSFGPDPFRRRLRDQARQNPTFMRAWVKLERAYRSRHKQQLLSWKRDERRRQKRDEARAARTKQNLARDRALIENGEHLGWISVFSPLYLHDRDRLSEYTDDLGLVETSLRNCLPKILNQLPTLEQLGEGQWWPSACMAFASCWLAFTSSRSLDDIDFRALAAAKVESARCAWMDESDYDAFERELDRILFAKEGSAAEFARRFIQPSFRKQGDETPMNVWWLSHKEFLAELRPTLSIEWLRRFPDMPFGARDQLFDIAAATADRTTLNTLIAECIRDLTAIPPHTNPEQEKRRTDTLLFWRLRRFFFYSSGEDGWEELRGDRDLVLVFERKTGRFADPSDGWPALGAEKVFKILDAFVEEWPPVDLPSSFGSDDPPEETAYRFLSEVVWRIGQDTPDRALPVLDRMLADPKFKDYMATLQTLRAEAAKKMALTDFSPPSPWDIVRMLDHDDIASVEDLRAFVIEELEWLQTWLRSAETSPLAETYYDADENHVDENTARNRVVDSLRWRLQAMQTSVVIEHYMADENRCDFTVSAMINGRRRLLVVEAKGQWHPELFTAASTQLNDRYSSHQDAEQQGIYLVFWFGPNTKVAGRVKHGLSSADELRAKITDAMPLDLLGRIDVLVLDLSRPALS